MPGPGIADLFVIREDGTGEQDVLGALVNSGAWYPADYPLHPAFGTDPTKVVFSGTDSIGVVGLDGTGLRWIAGVATEGSETPSVSPDGMTIAFASWDANGEGIRETSYAGFSPDPAHDGISKLLVEATSTRNQRHPAWGPGGALVYESVSVDGTTSNLFVVPASGGPPCQLTSGAYDDRNPTWAPAAFSGWTPGR